MAVLKFVSCGEKYLEFTGIFDTEIVSGQRVMLIIFAKQYHQLHPYNWCRGKNHTLYVQ
jgi:hypothetical protein